MNREIQIAADNVELNRVAANGFRAAALASIDSRGRFVVALSGGNTPRAVFALLAAEHAADIPWDKVHIFFGDERYVPASHPDSNFRMANEALLSHIVIPAENIHRVRTELDPESAARDYEDQLRFCFPESRLAQPPRLDLAMLGLGEDGHTASLFPGTSALNEANRLVVPVWVEKFKMFRITMTFPALNSAREVLFLTSGDSKAAILRSVLQPDEASGFPAGRIQPEHGRLVWLIDKAAARLLPPNLVPGA